MTLSDIQLSAQKKRVRLPRDIIEKLEEIEENNNGIITRAQALSVGVPAWIVNTIRIF